MAQDLAANITRQFELPQMELFKPYSAAADELLQTQKTAFEAIRPVINLPEFTLPQVDFSPLNSLELAGLPPGAEARPAHPCKGRPEVKPAAAKFVVRHENDRRASSVRLANQAIVNAIARKFRPTTESRQRQSAAWLG
jgi:hypothetical protein